MMTALPVSPAVKQPEQIKVRYIEIPVRSDDMQHTLQVGDYVTIDGHSITCGSQGIYCVQFQKWPGAFHFVRMQRTAKGVTLYYDIALCDAEIVPIDQLDSVRIYGRIVMLRRELSS